MWMFLPGAPMIGFIYVEKQLVKLGIWLTFRLNITVHHKTFDLWGEGRAKAFKDQASWKASKQEATFPNKTHTLPYQRCHLRSLPYFLSIWFIVLKVNPRLGNNKYSVDCTLSRSWWFRKLFPMRSAHRLVVVSLMLLPCQLQLMSSALQKVDVLRFVVDDVAQKSNKIGKFVFNRDFWTCLLLKSNDLKVEYFLAAW